MLKKLSEIIEINTKKIDSKFLNSANYISTENMMPYFGGIKFASSIPPFSVTKFSKGDILLSNIRPYFRKLWFSDRDGGCSSDVIDIKANSGVVDKYVFYALSTDVFFDYYVASCKGTKMPRGNKEALLEYQIEVPSLVEQQHIVNTTCFLLLKFSILFLLVLFPPLLIQRAQLKSF